MSRIQMQKRRWTCVIRAVFTLLIIAFPVVAALNAPQTRESVVPSIPHLFAPSNLQILAKANSTSLRLIWKDNSTGETGFVVETTRSGFTFTKVLPADTTHYLDSLDLDHTVTYRVRAISGGSSSPWSESIKWTSSPASPTNLTAKLSGNQNNHVDLSWKNNSKVNPSFLLLKATATNVLIKSIKIPAGQTSYHDTEVADNDSYGYVVMAMTAGGTSAQCNKVAVTILARPTNLTLNCFPGTFAPQLKWQDNSNAETGFIVERAVEGQKSNFDTFKVPANTTLYSDKVKPDTKYYYRVRAVCTYGGSANSNYLVWTSEPTKPQNLQVYSAVGDQVKIVWHDVSQTETQFLISRKSRKGSVLLKAPANSTSYVDSTITPGVTYQYSIAAINEDSKTRSDFTDQVGVTTLMPPYNLKAKAGSNTITLEWKGTLPPGCYYDIWRKIANGVFGNLASSGSPIFIDQNVTPGTTYTYRVRVKTANAMSKYSHDVKVSTMPHVNSKAIITQPVIKGAAINMQNKQ